MPSFVELCVIATAMQALVTGVFLATFFVCLRWLVFSDDGKTLRKPIHRPFLTVAVALFVFSVTDLSLTLQTTLLIFKGYGGMLHTSRVITYFIELLAPIITDGVLIFRCWVIYNRSWRVALLPLLLLLFNISSLLRMTYLNVSIPGVVPGNFVDQHDLFELGPFFASTTIINIYATSAIILRICRNAISRPLACFAIRVITESGLLYTLMTMATFCAMIVSPDSGLWITHAISFPTSLIAYNLILIRVAQNRTALREPELPTFISKSKIERVTPKIPQRGSEMVAS